MIKIDSVEWGKIVVGGKEYKQVLVVGEKVFERDSEKLHQLFGTTHQIGDWEVEELIKGKPEIIVIGTGWDGILEVSSKFPERISSKFNGAGAVQSSKLGIELKILKTPQAVEEYNNLVAEGKKVNALIHTTC